MARNWWRNLVGEKSEEFLAESVLEKKIRIFGVYECCEHFLEDYSRLK